MDIFGNVEDLLDQYNAAKAERAGAQDPLDAEDDLIPEDLDDAVAEAAARTEQARAAQ